jgi:hypothetical protein
VKIEYFARFLGVFLVVGGCGGVSKKRVDDTATGGESGETSGGGGSTAGSAGSATGGVGGKGGTPDPCAGLGCGEVCNPCNGSECPPMELPFRCNAEGECTIERPACLGRCTTVAECPIPPPDCHLCNSGTCAQMDCIDGACEMICDPMPHCSTGDECPSATECRLCADGSCAVVDCFKGRCDYVCPEL